MSIARGERDEDVPYDMTMVRNELVQSLETLFRPMFLNKSDCTT
jgi:hypothetical protein